MKTIRFHLSSIAFIVILYCSSAPIPHVLCGNPSLMFINEIETSLSEINNVNSGKGSTLHPLNEILNRKKRYLMWGGGGTVQVLLKIMHFSL